MSPAASSKSRDPDDPSPDYLSVAFQALADPTRRAILERLADGPAPAGELGAGFEISGPAISRHLKVLEEAGMIRREKQAQQRICHLDPAALKRASDWVDRYRQFWDEKLDALEAFLKSPSTNTSSSGKAARLRRPKSSKK